MKKIISAILICLVLFGSVLVLVSCGDIASGKYEDSITGLDIEISGDQFIIFEDDIKFVATYKVNEEKDKITLTFKSLEYVGNDSEERAEFESIKQTLEALAESTYCGTKSYSETEKGFKMGIYNFEKR